MRVCNRVAGSLEGGQPQGKQAGLRCLYLCLPSCYDAASRYCTLVWKPTYGQCLRNIFVLSRPEAIYFTVLYYTVYFNTGKMGLVCHFPQAVLQHARQVHVEGVIPCCRTLSLLSGISGLIRVTAMISFLLVVSLNNVTRFQIDAIPTVGFSDPILSYFSALQLNFDGTRMLTVGYEKVICLTLYLLHAPFLVSN